MADAVEETLLATSAPAEAPAEAPVSPPPTQRRFKLPPPEAVPPPEEAAPVPVRRFKLPAASAAVAVAAETVPEPILLDFYKRRAKKPDLYGYDGTGNLVIRNKDGSVEKTIALPNYKPLSLDDIARAEETRRDAIGKAEQEFETAMNELRAVIGEYREGRALPGAVKDAQLEVARRDEARTYAMTPDYGVLVIQNLAANKLFPENKYDKRILDYPVLKFVGATSEIKKSYVRPITQEEEAAEAAAADEAEAAGAELTVDVGFAEEKPAHKPSNILILFNHPDDNEFGYMSNEYPVEYNWKGVKYFTVDQALAAEKARFYGDIEALQRIMKTRSATTMRSEARKLGTAQGAAEGSNPEAVGAAAAVHAQKEAQWNEMKGKVLLSVLLAKFRQHQALSRKLLDTGDARIAYAESRNSEEGIGVALTNVKSAGNPAKWRGKNMLGEALMQVRTQLRGGAAEVTAAEATTVTMETISAAERNAQIVAGVIASRRGAGGP